LVFDKSCVFFASFAATKVTEASSFSDFKGSLTIASQRKNMVKKGEFDVGALTASFRAFTMF
jgi:hypothetical protein